MVHIPGRTRNVPLGILPQERTVVQYDKVGRLTPELGMVQALVLVEELDKVQEYESE